MRAAIIAAVFTVSMTAVGHSEPADDLVFCSKQSSKAERLACYDALARRQSLVGRSAIAQEPTHEAPQPINNAFARATSSPNPFAGFYAALGGGYGVSTDILTVVAGSTPEVHPAGPFVQMIVGNNVTNGAGLLGLEAIIRWDAIRAAMNESGNIAILTPPLSSFQVTYRFHEDFGVFFAGRVGLAFDQTMIFAKMGIGATHIRESWSFLGNPALFAPIVGSDQRSRFVPAGIFGIGTEHNIGRFFARAEIDMEVLALTALLTTTQTAVVTRGSASLGVRF